VSGFREALVLSAQKTADSPAALNAAALDPAAPAVMSTLHPAGAFDPVTVLDTCGVGWCLHGHDGELLHANALGWRLLATGPQPIVDLSGAPIAAQDHPVAVALRTGRATRGVVLGMWQGTPQARWVRVDTAVIERAPDAATSCVVTILVDVTRQTEHSREPVAITERPTWLKGPETGVICRLDAQARFVDVTRSAARVLGYQPEELFGRPLTKLVHVDGARDLMQALARTRVNGQGHAVVRCRRRDGELRWMDIALRRVDGTVGAADRPDAVLFAVTDAVFVPVPDDRPDELHAVQRDVSERIAGDQSLAAVEESSRLAFDSAPHGMARLTSDGRLQRVNDVLCTMVGRSRAELEGRPLQLLTHPDDADPVAELRDRLVTGCGEVRRDQRLRLPDGSSAWVDLTLTAVRDSGSQVRHLVAQLVDTTAERVLAEQLRKLDLHDRLTTAATADLLRERLDAALADPRRPGVALMRVDLDGFRRLNDARGQVVADRVLVVAVERLRAAAREGDLVARLGGDDFAVALVGVDHGYIERLAQKVGRALSGSVGGVGPVTASIGVATARAGDGTDDVLNRAEAALSVVKRSGGAGWAVD
jgi:diguanylate cyclase (GGDEF)-like protein/PAS domain S-box-containing protein